MSFEILTKLGEILNVKFEYSPEIIVQVKEIFSAYHSGSWIYPSVIKRFSGIKIEDVYKLLTELEHLSIVESWYELCCGHCQRVLGTVRQFNELPERFKCEVCGNKMSALENIIKIYRMI